MSNDSSSRGLPPDDIPRPETQAHRLFPAAGHDEESGKPVADDLECLCLEFENAFQAEAKPQIEAFLDRIAESRRHELFQELLLIELHNGVTPDTPAGRAACEARYPAYVSMIAKVWQSLYLPQHAWRSSAKSELLSPAPAARVLPGPATAPEAVAMTSLQAQLEQPDYSFPRGTLLDGRYQIERELGRGGFGLVLLAEEIALDRKVALKLPRPDIEWSSEQLDRFRDEARMVARFRERGIATIYQIFETSVLGRSTVCVVQQYVSGTSLSRWWERQQDRPDRYDLLAKLLADLSAVLEIAHREGLFHRDLKPDNILVDSDGQPYVLDFGLALHVSERTRSVGLLAGTVPYMAPEQVRGATQKIDARTDIWALGVVLYQLLAGRLPFEGPTWRDVFEAIKHADPQPPRQIRSQTPPELERITLKCLAKIKAERYASVSDLERELRSWREAPAEQARRYSRFESAANPAGTAIAEAGVARGNAGNHVGGGKGIQGATPAAASQAGGESPTDPAARAATARRGSGPMPDNSTHDQGALAARKPSTLSDQSAHALGSAADERGPSEHLQSAAVRIVPKGLRSFDGGDADFFLELLPGVRERNLLPASINFWKERIESNNPSLCMPVGVMFGPSGCGKSSLMKAGLLPRLKPSVIDVYLEATQDDTESQLLLVLRHKLPEIPAEVGLVEAMEGLARGRWLSEGGKVLVVLDQFEQWLYARRGDSAAALRDALVQCNGVRLQAILMVRNDFWTPASELVKQLDCRLQEGVNSESVPLLSPSHARRVLVLFGRAYGRLPATDAEVTKAQQKFLDTAIAELTEDEAVICVRVALFADMLRERDWTIATLEEIGGVKGVGEAFLEDRLASKHTPRARKRHLEAAKRVLKSLLPPSGTEIKGLRRSQEELAVRANYAVDGDDMLDLLRILDADLRLITPSANEVDNAVGYQLTHDYLVPSLREWLARKQRETRRGRAELRLAERAANWNAKQENRQLPALWEFFDITLRTSRKNWSESERRMMRIATWRQSLFVTASLLILAGVIASGWTVRNYVQAREARLQAESRERENRVTAEKLVDSLKTAETAGVPEIVKQLEPYREWADPLIQKQLLALDHSVEKLHLSLAYLEQDPGLAEYLYEKMLDAEPQRFPVIRDALQGRADEYIDRLWMVLTGQESDPQQRRLRAAAALAAYAPADPRWDGTAAEVAQQVTSINPLLLQAWMETLRPVRKQLTAPLSTIYRDTQRRASERFVATELLAEYVADQPNLLVDLLLDADEAQFATIFARLQPHREVALPLLEGVMQKRLQPDWQDQPLAAAWRVVEPALIKQIEAAEGLVAERFAFCQTMPLEQFEAICATLKSSGYRPTRVRPWYRTAPSTTTVGTSGSQASDSVDGVMVAAVWTRAGGDFCLALGRSAQEIRDRDDQVRKDGFVPVDVAGYNDPTSADPNSDRYIALWSQRNVATEEVRLLVGVKNPLTFTEEGWHFQTMQQFVDSVGRFRFSFVQRRQENATNLSSKLGKEDCSEKVATNGLQPDVAESAGQTGPSAREYYLDQLNQPEPLLDSGDPRANTARLQAEALRLRAFACSSLFDDVEAIPLLTAVLVQNPADLDARRYRAISLARLRDSEAAMADVAEFTRQTQDPSLAAYLDAVVASWLQDPTGLDRLRRQLAAHDQDKVWLYKAAGAFAIAADAFADDPARADAYEEESITLFIRSVAAGDPDYAGIRDVYDLESIRSRAEFQDILASGQLDRSYRAIWVKWPDATSYGNFESLELRGVSPAEHLAKCRALIDQQYRPVAISLVNSGSDLANLAASVWHRPLISDADRLDFAKRQADAAITLLRQGEREKIFTALRIDDDPESLTQFVHRCRARGVTVTDLWACIEIVERTRPALRGEARKLENRVLYGLLLGLGEFGWNDLTADQRERFVEPLAQWYRNDPSSAIHGATGWLLRRWGQTEVVRGVDETEVPYDVQREWFTLAIPSGVENRTLFQTYVVFPPGEYEIGSPWNERKRDDDEGCRQVRILQPFALLNREVTRAEYEVANIQRNNPIAQWSPTCEHPVVATSWYDAVRYSRWLTARRGLSEEDQCYEDERSLDRKVSSTDPQAEDAPRDWPLQLDKRGFRLPTEAEWEVACRSGMRTVFGFGMDHSLLDRYGWFQGNSGEQTHVAYSVRPNHGGLFDMHGNAFEWCHDWYGRYAAGSDSVGPRTGSSRVGRGGGWSGRAARCRSSDRDWDMPSVRRNSIGFRLALSPSGIPTSAETRQGE